MTKTPKFQIAASSHPSPWAARAGRGKHLRQQQWLRLAHLILTLIGYGGIVTAGVGLSAWTLLWIIDNALPA